MQKLKAASKKSSKPTLKKQKAAPKKKTLFTTKRKVVAKKKATHKSTASSKVTPSKTKTKRVTHKPTLSKTAVKKPVKVVAKKPKKTNMVMHDHFTDAQKAELLISIQNIINLRKGTKDGLKSYAVIDRILDRNNQQYKHSSDKFDAIVNYGMEKDPKVTHEHMYLMLSTKEEDTVELYAILSLIGKEKMNFALAKDKISSLYAKSFSIREKINKHETA